MPTITKTIGTSGRDYSTIVAWEADLDDAGIYSSGDDAVGECYNDAAFDEQPTVNGGATVGLATVKLTVATGEHHDGTAGTGARIVRSTNGITLTVSRRDTTVEWLEIDYTNHAGPYGISCGVGDSNTFHHIIVHDMYAGGTAFTAGLTIATGSPYQGGNGVFNSIIYRIRQPNRFNVRGFTTGRCDGAGYIKFNNCTVFNIYMGGSSLTADTVYGFGSVSTNVEVKNCVACDVTLIGTGPGAVKCFNLGTVSYSASSDATASGTGSLTNIVTANQFVSTVTGSEDLHLKAGSDCIDAGTDLGTTPAGVNMDINGRDRDSEDDTWDIGAHEYGSKRSITVRATGTFGTSDANIIAYTETD